MARMTITEIKEKRKAVGVSQIELARHSSVERSKLSRAENGQKLLADEELQLLEQALVLIWKRRITEGQQALSG